MSIHAIGWALKQQLGRSAEKFVLVCLANYANEDGISYPSVAALQSDTCQDRKTVIRVLQALQESGLIADTGHRTGSTKQIPVYRLMLANSTENGTVPKTEQSRFSAETVPFFPGNSPVFPHKESQKRDTEPSGTIKEPSRNQKKPQAALPDWLPLDAWTAYLEMRKKNRFPATEYAETLLIKELGAFRDQGLDVEAVLNTAITRNWRGLFPPKEEARAGQTQPRLTANQQMQQNVMGAILGRTTRRTIDVDATEVQPRRLVHGEDFRANYGDLRDTEDDRHVVGSGGLQGRDGG